MSSELYKEELVKRLELASNNLVDALTRSVQNVLTTCVTCDHWDQAAEVCILYGRQRPPARVIAFGCPAFVNEIPF